MKYLCAIAMTAMALAVSAQTGHYTPYSVSSDFREVANRKQFLGFSTLTADHRALLRKNLFVISPRGDDQLYWVYGVNDYHNLSTLVTTDTVLHLYHVFFDSTLRNIEEVGLLSRLEQLTSKMLAESEKQVAAAPTDVAKVAAQKNVAYFKVASELLNSGSARLGPMATAEVQHINAGSGIAESAIFGYEVDYSRFIVRGHYTRSAALKRYFRAMTWYGLMPFALADRNGAPQPEQIRMAVMVADALHTGGAEADWQAIYDPTSLYVGSSNAVTPQEVRAIVTDVFGSSNNLDPAKFPAFVNQVRTLHPAKIQARKNGNAPNPEVQFRFMGMRYIPDSEVLQRLTGQARPMPSALDIMAVLGSARAAAILDGNPGRYNPSGWTGYFPERSKLAAEFLQVPASTWNSNLYWGWLDTLRLAIKPVPAGYPQFMRNQAWQDKTLSTALASWTEMRHDTILYGEQSVAEQGDEETVPPFVKGFVEPNVAVYDRLLALTKQSRVELQRRKLIDESVSDNFVSFEDLLKFLSSVSKKELAGTPLTKDEHLHIRHIEADLGGLTQTMLLYGNNFKALTDDDWNMALIADVHTGNGAALEEGVGKADDIIAIVPIDGKLYFARGCTFSCYEFTKPIAQRMTDEAWKKLVDTGTPPPRPAWTSSFFTSKPVKDKDKQSRSG